MKAAVFHAGEQALQMRLGTNEHLQEVGPRVIRDHMPEQHRELFGKLPTLILAVQDDQGQPWPTMLHGPSGFITSPDDTTLCVQAWPDAGDPDTPSMVAGRAIGLLGIEPHTRRRNRANGRLRAVLAQGFEVHVTQSFGNCPKYIHARRLQAQAAVDATPEAPVVLGSQLNEAALALIRRADTLYIASANGAQTGTAWPDGVDVSHRGGLPGFVTVHAGQNGWRLTLPDYRGNGFFNTLGNLLVWPQAGVLVPDFVDGSLLHLAANATIEFDGAALAQFPGAQRLLHLDVRSGCYRPRALPLRWSSSEMPPQFAGAWGA
jgi:predicted pyridoxine 5'-phosphate oxidase superfamily flavin-nucleotide-binding protein